MKPAKKAAAKKAPHPHHQHPGKVAAKKAAAKKAAAKKAASNHPGKRAAAKKAAAAKKKSAAAKKGRRAGSQPGTLSAYVYEPDAPDARDHVYSGRADFAEFVDLSPAMPPIWDQGDQDSCVAHAVAAAHVFAGGGAVALEAVRIRPALRACAAHGAGEYLTVGRSVAAVQACLSSGFPVVAGLTLFESFQSDEALASGVVSHPVRRERVAGPHCVLVVGIGYGREWRGQFPAAVPGCRYVKVRNSWGVGVYRGGYLLLPAAYLYRHAADLWTLRSA